jgi:hypothetical protein
MKNILFDSYAILSFYQDEKGSPEIIADALVSLMEEKNGKTDNHKDTGRLVE